MDITLRPAERSDLPQLHALASAAMTLDKFSPDLLAQKLFYNPHPGRDEYQTLMAEISGRVVGMMQSVIRPSEAKAWLGLFAVAADCRRKRVARRMFDATLATWRGRGVQMADTLTIPTNYLLPGIDPRYTPAICFIESVGFVQRAAKANMCAYLDSEFDTRRQETELQARGIEIRRAAPEDAPAIEQFFATYFGEGWLAECRESMKVDPPALHLAWRDGRIIAFSAHSSMNQEWGNFGPMGTADDARGMGLGQLLLHRCMADLKAAGHAISVIPWIGPYPFYSRFLNCHIERVFWQHRLDLTQPA